MFDVTTRKWTELQCTGYIPSPREGHAAALVDDVMYVFGGRGVDGTDLSDLTAFKLSSEWGGAVFRKRVFVHETQPSDGSCSKTWGQVQLEGPDMLWPLVGHEYLCSEESLLQEPQRMRLLLFTFLTRVRVRCLFALIGF
jgi:hypothetical protein